MKNWYLAFAALLVVSSTSAQQSVINWHFSSKKVSANVYEVTFTATLEKGWHIYSGQPGEGPVPTTISFAPSPVLSLKGRVKEAGNIKIERSTLFNSEISYYENNLTLIQYVQVRGTSRTAIKGSIDFMVCDNQQCLPPKKIAFSILLA
jgi:DsbC/DsbD-like thiol-disulfide interchange protein